MGFKTTFKAGYVKRIRPVCNVGLLLSNKPRAHCQNCRPARIGNANKNQPTPQAQKCNSNNKRQQKETPILRWKNGPLFWVPYWKRNSAQCQHRKRTPKRGPFFGPQNGVRLLVKLWGLLLQRFCAWHAPGLFEYEILCRPTFLIWLMVCCLAIYQPRANICNCGETLHVPGLEGGFGTHFSEPATTLF